MSAPSEMSNGPERVENGIVVSIEYTLHVNGEIMDFSEKDEPLQYLHGKGQVIPGLEHALDGMSVGQNKKVLVQAAEAYGNLDPSAIVQVSRAEFPEDIPLEVGTPIQVRNIDGEVMDAHIINILPDYVELDFNHPLAGKNLEFNVTIVALRLPSPEELEHGHVHNHGDEDEDEDYDFEDDEDFDDDDDDEDDEEENDELK